MMQKQDTEQASAQAQRPSQSLQLPPPPQQQQQAPQQQQQQRTSLIVNGAAAGAATGPFGAPRGSVAMQKRPSRMHRMSRSHQGSTSGPAGGNNAGGLLFRKEEVPQLRPPGNIGQSPLAQQLLRKSQRIEEESLAAARTAAMSPTEAAAAAAAIGPPQTFCCTVFIPCAPRSAAAMASSDGSSSPQPPEFVQLEVDPGCTAGVLIEFALEAYAADCGNVLPAGVPAQPHCYRLYAAENSGEVDTEFPAFVPDASITEIAGVQCFAMVLTRMAAIAAAAARAAAEAAAADAAKNAPLVQPPLSSPPGGPSKKGSIPLESSVSNLGMHTDSNNHHGNNGENSVMQRLLSSLCCCLLSNERQAESYANASDVQME